MSKSKVNQLIRKSVEGILNFENNEVMIEIEDIGEVKFIDLFKIFNGENVKINISISNDGYNMEDGENAE